MRLQSVLLFTLLSQVLSHSAFADDGDHASADVRPTQELHRISVTGTRGARELDEIAATVTVKSDDEIARELSTNIKDLVRYEPGISVADAPTRFGLAGFNIRGIEGNRVLTRIDGVRTSDAFSIGSFSDARRNLIDLDAVKSVEIIRGPASALYGSDAIGGVVSFVLKDPLDYLDNGRSSYVGARSGYQSEDNGWFAGSTLALGNETLSGLVTYTHREGHETENQGSIDTPNNTRTKPNPQQYDSDSVLAKAVWRVSDAQLLRLTVDAERSNTDTNVLSGVGIAGTVNTQSQLGDDSQKRTRISLTHEIDAATVLFDHLEWHAYWQDSEVEQRTFEQRFSTTVGPVSTVTRRRRFDFDQSLLGADLTLRKDFTLGSTDHRITYGFEGVWSDTAQLRDGVQQNLATGMTTSNILPDSFPVRDFPKTRTQQLALYLQDEISIADGVWKFIPAVRVDDYRLTPKPDAIFIADNPGVGTANIRETSVTPKLGAIWAFADHLSAYAQYAHGFRAPPYNDVNIGFTNLAFGYTAIANPNLKPEKSEGYELGLRGSFDTGFFTLATFYTDYKDLIDSLGSAGVVNGLQVFQSQNLSSARIYGAELRGALDLSTLSTSLTGWKLNTSVAYARGDNRVTGQPLNSVDPVKGVLGIGYDARAGRWGVELIGTAVARKSSVDNSAGNLYVPAGYMTVDLLAHMNFSERAQVNIGIFNLADRKYFEWADVRGRLFGDSVIDRYSRPGLNASINGTLRF